MATKTTAPVEAPAEPAAPALDTTASAVPTAATNGFSITALVLGITGIVLGQWLLSVGAIVFGFVARAKEPGARLTANWGLVLGFVGVFGGLLLAIIGAVAFAPLWFFGAFGPWDIANLGMWDVWDL